MTREEMIEEIRTLASKVPAGAGDWPTDKVSRWQSARLEAAKAATRPNASVRSLRDALSVLETFYRG